MSRIKDYTDTFFNGKVTITKEVRQDIILSYLPLVRIIASRLADKIPSGNPGCSLEDFQQDGIFGLIDAIEKFDPIKRIQFRTYAEFRIRGAIVDKIRNLSWIPRRIIKANKALKKTERYLEQILERSPTVGELSTEIGMSETKIQKLLEGIEVSFIDINSINQKMPDDCNGDLFDFIIDENSLDPLYEISVNEIREIVWQKVKSLPSKERTVIVLYYLFDLTMLEIGNIMDYTESRISQVHSGAIILLKKRMQKYDF